MNIALCQINTTVGDFDHNYDKILDNYINNVDNSNYITNYFTNYLNYLKKNSFNSFLKGVIKPNF